MILLKLFLSFLKVGFFAVGGAYSFLPLIEKEVVQYHQWLGKPEFLEILGISTIFPGAISIKFATYTGYKMAGVPGAIVANLGNLIPPAILIFVVTLVYSKYKDLASVKSAFTMVRYTVFAMIIAVAIQLVDKKHIFEFKHVAVIIVSFLLFMLTKIHPAFIIVCAGLLGALIKYH